MACALFLLLAAPAPVLDSFDRPLDPLRWYVGVPGEPRKGRLTIPKDGWIVSRAVPDEGLRKIEIVFRSRGGELEGAFHGAREPLSSPKEGALRLSKGGGDRTLALTPTEAFLDGEKIPWEGALYGTFRLAAHKGAVEIDEVRVEPRPPDPPDLGMLERANVHFATTPQVYRDEHGVYDRVSLMLWDAEVCFLRRRGEPSFAVLRAPPKGAPVLGALVATGDGSALALKASSHPRAMRDWNDERVNMPREDFLRYLAEEYAVMALLMDAQRALNAAVPGRDDLDPLVHLAVIRHTPNVDAAIALAETQGAKKALQLLEKALGKDARPSGDRVRQAAGEAARELLGEIPPQWPNFTFDPKSRYVTIQQSKELAR